MTRKGFLIDLDGVLYQGGMAIPGACDAIGYLTRKGIPFRCISNTTRKCRETIRLQLSGMGFDIPIDHIFTPPLAAVSYMRRTKKDRYYLLVTGDVDRDFAGTGVCSPESADYVIVGDAGDVANYHNLNIAFRLLMNGADLIALERDRYWMAHDGLALSAGPFVSALEYATGKTAVLMGKPSETFFDLALRDMGISAKDATMIGDDLLTDVGGAQKAGMAGILVRTGKYYEGVLKQSSVKPDTVIDSIADIPSII